jgi:hypothetical protein
MALREYGDALTYQKGDLLNLVRLYAVLGHIRLISSGEVVVAAEAAIDKVTELYHGPNFVLDDLPRFVKGGGFDELRTFDKCGRAELVNLHATGLHEPEI